MKAYSLRKGIAPLILNPCIRWRYVTPPLLRRKPLLHIELKAMWGPESVWRTWRKDKFLTPRRDSNCCPSSPWRGSYGDSLDLTAWAWHVAHNFRDEHHHFDVLGKVQTNFPYDKAATRRSTLHAATCSKFCVGFGFLKYDLPSVGFLLGVPCAFNEAFSGTCIYFWSCMHRASS